MLIISKEKPKPYKYVVIISIILITGLSMVALGLISSYANDESTRYSEIVEELDNYADLARDDIQVILAEDSAKFETSYSYMNDLYLLAEQYTSMYTYNQTNPSSYSQQDFNDVLVEFTLKMKSMISIVNETSVYEYSVVLMGANEANNFTFLGFENYFINNQWYIWLDTIGFLHSDLKDYITAAFILSGDPLVVPLIDFEKWTYHLFNNLSILHEVGPNVSSNYAESLVDDYGISLVNLSLSQVSIYSDKYSTLYEDINSMVQNLNNTLITLALSGVLMGFTVSFNNINFRRVSLVVGLIVLLLSIIYFATAVGTMFSLPTRESTIIGINGFVFQ